MKTIYDNPMQASLIYAYLAGIVDGEGTIRIGKGGSTKYYAQISVGMTDKRVIELLVEKLGSKMRIEKESVPNGKIIYRWGTSGNIGVPKIIKKILPYLITKKRQAELVIQFCEGYKKGVEEERICRKCEKKKKIAGYGLCANCYQWEYKHKTLERYKKNYRPPKFIPIMEIQRREEFYWKVRKLNAVGAAATTE